MENVLDDRTKKIRETPDSPYYNLLFHEIKHFQTSLGKRIEQLEAKRGERKEIMESDIKMTSIPKKHIDILVLLFGIIGGIILGGAVTIVMSGDLNYWKAVSCGLLFVFGFVFIFLTIFLHYHKS